MTVQKSKIETVQLSTTTFLKNHILRVLCKVLILIGPEYLTKLTVFLADSGCQNP